jgi:hypothetical protein
MREAAKRVQGSGFRAKNAEGRTQNRKDGTTQATEGRGGEGEGKDVVRNAE